MQQTETPARVTETESPSSAAFPQKVALSIVVPVMNEEQSVRPLFDKVSTQIEKLGKTYEIIFVDDGSTDNTFNELKKLYEEHTSIVRVIRFRRNFSKTPALVAGFSRCRGDVIFTIDGDLQDDPEEMSRFLEKLDEGYDLVTGWKFPRLDPISKTFPSRIFNWLVSVLTGVHLHDINNGFKAYRRELIEDPHLKLYGEFHRFVPVMAHWRGFRVAEIKVRHHPRKFGVSKFGTRRFARGLIDLLNVLFLTSFLRTPLRLFGPLGFFTFLAGVLVDIFVVCRRFFFGQPIHEQPLLFVGILLMIFGVQFVVTGLQSEMIRHYAFQPGEEYSIKQELDSCNGQS
jgi:glycosyltransferase involved in cell wall biosynthesis